MAVERSQVVSGAVIKHVRKPEWELGTVLAHEGLNVRVRFADGERAMRLALSLGLLELATPEEIATAAEHETAKAAARRAPATATGTPCRFCGKALNRSYYRQEKAWKSCPRCSSRHGSMHVYLRYPDAFGTTDARASSETPDGAQSYCTDCRAGGTAGGAQRTCDAFAR